eukprot:jgi/Ulvmu1/12603/UM092_0033.1
MGDVTKQKKIIMPFFDRASQCESVAPIAAYYTRYAGMLKGLAIKPLHPDIESVLLAMMAKLEADKTRLGLSGDKDPAKKAEDEDELRSFALKVFAIADRTDQLGARDAKLLNKYMSARTFLQAFEAISDDELPSKETELLKYCNVRCFQLSKALKAGEPVPPPPAPPGADTRPEDGSSDAILDEQLAKLTADDAARAAAPRPVPPPVSTSIPDLPTPPPAPEVPQYIEPRNIFPAYYTAGAHILYRAGPHHAPQHGRVIRTHDGRATITTTSATADAAADQLAPYLPSGSEVMISVPLHPGTNGTPEGIIEAPPAGLPPGRTIPATVLHDDSDSRWPPQYTVRLPDASSATVLHSLFTAVTLPPGAGGGPPVRGVTSPMASAAPNEMPSAPPTLPGIPRQNFGLATPDANSLTHAAPASPPHSSAYPSPAFAAPPAYQSAPSSAYPAPSPPASPTPPTYAAPPQPPPQQAPAATYQYQPLQPAAAAASGPLTHAQKEAAKKAAKQAISALNFDDVQSAVDALRGALAALGAPVQPVPGGHPPAPPSLSYSQRDSSQRSAKSCISALSFDDNKTAKDSLRASLASIFS